jgi:hypothetical protein
MRTGKADTLHARHLVHLLQQAREVAFRIVGRLVVVHDLPEELDLAMALVGRLADLGENLRRRPHPLVAPGVRHHAEGAELVAAFDDVDVGLHRVRPARDPERERHVLVRVDVDLRTDGVLQRTGHQHRQLLDPLGAHHHVDEP